MSTIEISKTQDPYYSRESHSWEAAHRQDPIIWGDHSGPLSEDLLHQYETQGFVSEYSPLQTEEVEKLLREADRLRTEADVTQPDVIIEPNTQAVRTVFRTHRTSEVIMQLLQKEEIAGVARQLLGGDVYIHQSRINFKPPFSGKEFFWHSDFETWHIEDGMPRMRAVSFSINLTENNDFNGPLLVIPKSHLRYVRCIGETPENHFEQSLRKQEYGVPSLEAMELLVNEGGIVASTGPAGAATIFECNTMHGSVGNISPFPRINLFVVFNSLENSVVDPFGNRPPRPEFLAEREFTPVEQL